MIRRKLHLHSAALVFASWAGSFSDASAGWAENAAAWFKSLPTAPNDGRVIVDWTKCWAPKNSLPQGGFKVACRPIQDKQPADFALMTSKNEFDKHDINFYRVQITNEVQTLNDLANGGVNVVDFQPRVQAVACYKYPDKTCAGFLMRWITDPIEVQDFSAADPDLKASREKLMTEFPNDVKPLPNLDARLDLIKSDARCAAAKNTQADFLKIASFEAKHYYIADLQGFLLPDGHFLVMDPGKGDKKGPGRSTQEALKTLEAYIKAHC